MPKPRSLRHTAMMAWVLSVVGTAGTAQSRSISETATCPGCTIRTDTIALLSGVHYIGPSGTIAVGSDGSFLLGDPRDRLIKQYSPTGEFVRQIGRPGAGPGEYQMVRNILVDSLGLVHVLDGALGRHSIYSPSGAFLRSYPLRLRGGMGWGAQILPSGRLAMNAPRTAETSARGTVSLVDSSGAVLAQVDSSGDDWRATWNQQRLFALRADGSLFVAHPFTLRIVQYSPRFAREAVFARVANWIPSSEPVEDPSDGAFERPVTTQLWAMWFDAAGRLWLYVVRPHPDWKPGPARSNTRGFTAAAILKLRDRPRVEGVLEVIDLQRQRVLTRTRIPDGLGLPFGGGYFAKTIESEDGEPSLLITRVKINH